jgi:hypothetical protein
LIDQCERGVTSGDGFYNALSQLLQALAVERAGPRGRACRGATCSSCSRGAA